ncbi:MAG: Thiol peroxidase, Bcp-type [Candidatus Rifleibacterium amylolyticum]|nr:MAG: Thiol peroxidase, Bcp-type [Candidatus Rifleibacterium amylolyticum]
MIMRKTVFYLLLVGFIMASGVCQVFAADSKIPTSMVTIGEGEELLEPEVELKIGDKAPEFSLPNLSTDKMEHLKDYLGKPIILFFIQSACYSCLQEAKALQELKATYGDRVNVIAVGVDLLGKPMLVSWAAHNNINYPVLLDPIFSVPEKYGFSFTPSSVIIDKDGLIAFIHAGFRPADINLIEGKIKELLGS